MENGEEKQPHSLTEGHLKHSRIWFVMKQSLFLGEQLNEHVVSVV